MPYSGVQWLQLRGALCPLLREPRVRRHLQAVAGQAALCVEFSRHATPTVRVLCQIRGGPQRTYPGGRQLQRVPALRAPGFRPAIRRQDHQSAHRCEQRDQAVEALPGPSGRGQAGRGDYGRLSHLHRDGVAERRGVVQADQEEKAVYRGRGGEHHATVDRHGKCHFVSICVYVLSVSLF